MSDLGVRPFASRSERPNEPGRYKLNRISLPEYSGEAFDSGNSDFPTDVLVKVFAKELSLYVRVHRFALDSATERRAIVGRLAPSVVEMYMRYSLNNLIQSEIMSSIMDGTYGQHGQLLD